MILNLNVGNRYTNDIMRTMNNGLQNKDLFDCVI